MHRMRVAVVLCAAAGALILPARAAALVYPVSDSDGLTTALATAAGTAASDTIELAAGLYPGSFSYGAASPIEIVGAGPALTTIQTNASYAGISLDNGSAANSRIANLGVEITGGTTVRAINAGGTGATVEDVALTTSGGSNLFGIELNASGATIRRVTSSGAFSRVISSYAGSSSISDVTLTGNGSGSGIEADAASSNVVVRRARLSQFGTAAAAKFSGTLVITDSLIDLRGLSSAAALVVGDNNNNSANTSTLTADRLTIAGDAEAAAVNLAAGSVNEPDVMTATVRDSIISGFDTPLECFEGGTVPKGVINVSDTVLTGGTNNTCTDDVGDPGITTTNTTAADPKFVDAGAGDFRLRWDSPLLDLVAQTPDPGLTDLLDEARVVDGNGDGTATADLGAYEYQRTAPVIGTAAYSRVSRRRMATRTRSSARRRIPTRSRRRC